MNNRTKHNFRAGPAKTAVEAKNNFEQSILWLVREDLESEDKLPVGREQLEKCKYNLLSSTRGCVGSTVRQQVNNKQKEAAGFSRHEQILQSLPSQKLVLVTEVQLHPLLPQRTGLIAFQKQKEEKVRSHKRKGGSPAAIFPDRTDRILLQH